MTDYLSFDAPVLDRREILRYARSKSDENLEQLLEECISKSDEILNYNVGFCELNFTIDGDLCDFGAFSIRSRSLSENIFCAKKVYLFVASIGHGIDRLIAKYSRTSPLLALLFNAIGTERVEALSDLFVSWLEKENKRFLFQATR